MYSSMRLEKNGFIKQYTAVLNKLGEIENIGSAHITFVMGGIKNTYSIPLD